MILGTDTKIRRRRVTLTIREDILRDAKALALNTSQAAEAGIAQALRNAQAGVWLAENQSAILAHNTRVEAHGTLIRARWAQ
jgi:antitoxin CcdA